MAGKEKRKSTFYSQVLINEDYRKLDKQEDDVSQNPRKGSCSTSEELFIYLCPVANCRFAIDLQVCCTLYSVQYSVLAFCAHLLGKRNNKTHRKLVKRIDISMTNRYIKTICVIYVEEPNCQIDTKTQ